MIHSFKHLDPYSVLSNIYQRCTKENLEKHREWKNCHWIITEDLALNKGCLETDKAKEERYPN